MALKKEFRQAWNKNVQKQLYKPLKEQAATWHPLYLIMFFGDTPSDIPGQPSSWIRVAKLVWSKNLFVETKDGLIPWLKVDWKQFLRIQDVFPEIGAPDKWKNKVLEATISLSKSLSILS